MNSKLNKNPRILLVEDERVVLAILRSGLNALGYVCAAAESVLEAESQLEEGVFPDLVVLDVGLPDKSGLLLAEYLSLIEVPFLLLTAFSDQATIDEAAALGALGYLVKPITVKQLAPAIDAALMRAAELQQLKQSEAQLKTALRGDRDISIAIGITMAKSGMDYQCAFEQLRASARKQNKKLVILAKEVIDNLTLI